MTTHESVTIPGWTLRLFTIVQPIVVFAAGWVIVEMRGLRDQVTILNVQMEQALRTEQKFETLRDQFNVLSLRLAHLEGKREGQASAPDASGN